MADDVKRLSAELAQDPQSLVFLQLGELLRRKKQFDAALRVALHGLQRHPHLADAHDLYARILADRRDYAQAFDEWDMALQIAPNHGGALKGLAFLYFQVGDLAQAEAHLQAALNAVPEDLSLQQALALVRGEVDPQAAGQSPALGGDAVALASAAAESPQAAAPSPPPPPAPPAATTRRAGDSQAGTADRAMDEARVFAGLEGAQEGLLLLDAVGRVLGGGLRDPQGTDVTDAVAAYLAGVSQEASRTAKLLGLGAWTGLSAEGRLGHVHLTPPGGDALLLVVRDRAVPMGRLAVLAQRAAQAARRWLERHT